MSFSKYARHVDLPTDRVTSCWPRSEILVTTLGQNHKRLALTCVAALNTQITALRVSQPRERQKFTNLVESVDIITWFVVEGNLAVTTTCATMFAAQVDRSRITGVLKRDC